jgi:hypothetical protein
MVAVGIGRTRPREPPVGPMHRGCPRGDTRRPMRTHHHHHAADLVDRPTFESYLRLLAVVGMTGLGLWLLIAALAVVSGVASVEPSAVFPFLLAVLTLLVPRILYPEIRRWPYRHLSAAQRLGLDDRDSRD